MLVMYLYSITLHCIIISCISYSTLKYSIVIHSNHIVSLYSFLVCHVLSYYFLTCNVLLHGNLICSILLQYHHLYIVVDLNLVLHSNAVFNCITCIIVYRTLLLSPMLYCTIKRPISIHSYLQCLIFCTSP
jgi:hypothetical protein